MNERMQKFISREVFSRGRACVLLPSPLWTKDKAEYCRETKFILARGSVVIWSKRQKISRPSFHPGTSLHVSAPTPQQSPGAPNNTMTIALMNDHKVSGQDAPFPGRKMKIWVFPQPLAGQVVFGWKTDGGVGGWAGTPSHMRPHRRASQSGRQEVAVVSRGTSSLKHLTIFTERGCSSRKGLTTEPRRLVFSALVTRNILLRGPWRTESFSKNAWLASHLSKSLLSVLFLLEHNQIHGTVRIKP